MNILIIFFPILLGVAYVTVAERKIMASMQRRIGPNYIGYYGLLQAFADAVKLLVKEIIIPQNSSKLLFVLSPVLTLVMSLLLWGSLPLSENIFIYENSISILINSTISSLSVYGIILAGWSANSKYAFLGSIRSANQIISYELILSGILALLIYQNFELDFISQLMIQSMSVYNSVLYFPILTIYSLGILAETNRTPFDLPEAESELVSGFSTEHAASIFVFFFLGEYSNVLYWSAFSTIMFFGGLSNISFLLVSFIVMLFIWIRATLPRLKYNQLMNLCWNGLLPFIFSLFIIGPILIGIN